MRLPAARMIARKMSKGWNDAMPAIKTLKKFFPMMLALVLALTLGGCNLVENTASPTADPDSPHPVATITMENGDVMRAELYPEYAPNTVANFIELANSGLLRRNQLPPHSQGLCDTGGACVHGGQGRRGLHHQGRDGQQRL